MEHHFLRLFLIIALLFISGCKKPLESPELQDVIYLEISDAIKKTDAQMQEDRKALTKDKEDLKKPDLTLGEKRQLLKEIANMEKRLQMMEQDLTFMQIRLKTRYKHISEVYPRRFEQGLPWPDPEELEQWEAHKKLQHAPKNWSDRIPKLRYGPEKGASAVESPQGSDQ